MSCAGQENPSSDIWTLTHKVSIKSRVTAWITVMIRMTGLFIYKVDTYSVGLYWKQAAPCNIRPTSDEGHTSASPAGAFRTAPPSRVLLHYPTQFFDWLFNWSKSANRKWQNHRCAEATVSGILHVCWSVHIYPCLWPPDPDTVTTYRQAPPTGPEG